MLSAQEIPDGTTYLSSAPPRTRNSAAAGYCLVQSLFKAANSAMPANDDADNAYTRLNKPFPYNKSISRLTKSPRPMAEHSDTLQC
jgi:hypothetical protein